MTTEQVSSRAAQALNALKAGQPAEAERIAKEMAEQHPTHALSWAVLGEVMARLPGRQGEAWSAYSRALAIRPEWTALRGNLAVLLRAMGRHQESREQLRAIVQADPANEQARLSLAESALLLGLEDEALQELEALTARQPRFAAGWIQLSWLQLRRRELDDALNCARHAVAADGKSGRAHAALAEALFESGEAQEARAHYDKAIALAPEQQALRARRLLVLSHVPRLPLDELVAAHREEGARVAREAGPAMPAPAAAREPGRIRVGYVSADFLRHSVAVFFTPALLAHDRTKVSLTAYYTQPLRKGDRAGVAAHFDQWRECGAMTDAELARQIRADAIDVLIDLSGHTAHNRLGVFALKPARVHWQWFGYPLLTGLDAFDARLTDGWLDPAGDNPAGETLLRLPSRLTWAPGPGHPAVADTPCLSGQPFTFGSFNGLRKMNPELLDAWVAILRAVPGSRLRMGHMDSAAFESDFRGRLRDAGLDPGRLEVLPTLAMGDYLAAHAGIDLLLDSFPHNGGTTTMLALWQGVPVLTLAGRYGPHRLTTSLLLQLGLQDLVADSTDDYVARAAALASEPAKLQSWRAGLRERILAAPLGNPKTVVAELEAQMARALG